MQPEHQHKIWRQIRAQVSDKGPDFALLKMMAGKELPESTVDWIPLLEKVFQKSLADHSIADDCANLVGALFAH